MEGPLQSQHDPQAVLNGAQVSHRELPHATAQTAFVHGAHLVAHRDASGARRGRRHNDGRSRSWPGEQRHHHHRAPRPIQRIRGQHDSRARLADFAPTRGIKVHPPHVAAPHSDGRRDGLAHPRSAVKGSASKPSATVPSHSAISAMSCSSCSTSRATRYSGSSSPPSGASACSSKCCTNALRPARWHLALQPPCQLFRDANEELLCGHGHFPYPPLLSLSIYRDAGGDLKRGRLPAYGGLPSPLAACRPVR